MSFTYAAIEGPALRDLSRRLGEQVGHSLGRLMTIQIMSVVLTGVVLLGLGLFLWRTVGSVAVTGPELVWAGLLLVLVTGGWVLWIAGLRAARRAVNSVTALAATGSAPALASDTRRRRVWLTTW